MRKLVASGYDLHVTSRFALWALLCLPACSGTNSMAPMCDDSGTTTTLTVSVVNDSCEPMNICDATVTATGPTTVTLSPTGGTSKGSCAYSGTFNAGDYAITAAASATCKTSSDCFAATTVHQSIQAGCPSTAAIDVVLTP
jgi:hypothetical protein